MCAAEDGGTRCSLATHDGGGNRPVQGARSVHAAASGRRRCAGHPGETPVRQNARQGGAGRLAALLGRHQQSAAATAEGSADPAEQEGQHRARPDAPLGSRESLAHTHGMLLSHVAAGATLNKHAIGHAGRIELVAVY